MIDDEIDSQKPLPWGYPGEVIAHRRYQNEGDSMDGCVCQTDESKPAGDTFSLNCRRHSSQAPKGKVKVRLAQELWLVDGELTIPWVRFQDGSGARGLAVPTPVVLEKGSEVEIEWGHTND